MPKKTKGLIKINTVEFTEYVTKFQPNIFRLAYSYVKNTADAEDITQEVFLRLYRSSETFISYENAKAWLIKVTINTAKNYLRSLYRKHKVALTEDIALNDEKDYALLEALNRLNKNYRVVIYLHYYEGYPVSEIASMLGISENNVKQRLKRGRDKLRTYLTD
ncbi:MAG: RNA polymerase sigma factor [Ruminiclostridium sp.]|nr:RNA polymerase sigma factor [Ruminiclostridium sp.]